MTNLSHGQKAENIAAQYLKRRGYEVVVQNWKTAHCEIDIIAKLKNSMYFVEVKYRRNTNQGRGMDYVTPQKQAQMARAAESWVQVARWEGDYRLSAIEVSGENYEVTEFIDDI